jgi:hypothetical protein
MLFSWALDASSSGVLAEAMVSAEANGVSSSMAVISVSARHAVSVFFMISILRLSSAISPLLSQLRRKAHQIVPVFVIDASARFFSR